MLPVVMQSLNFEFLRPSAPDLAELGGFAESYAHPDPSSAAVKLRTLVERLVLALYEDNGLRIPEKPSLNDLLRDPRFKLLVPKPVLYKLDALRINGNKAAHGEPITGSTSLWMLSECHAVGSWFYLTYLDGEKEKITTFKEPPAGGLAAASAAEREARLQALIRELDQVKAQVARAPDGVERVTRLYPRVPEERATYEPQKSVAPVSAQPNVLGLVVEGGARVRGLRISDELGFDEDTTRKRLIDTQLIQAGWAVGPNGASTDEVGQEIEVQHQPTDSGVGYADYVLWDENGKPLAVIEVKKTVERAEKGQTQGRIYADGLEKTTGQRPVIFYTNGFDIWIWDDAQRYPPRGLFGFYSRDSLQYLIYQRTARKALNTVPIREDIVERLYQHECIKRVSERFAAQRRRSLIVQATGTGKTRVAVALAELMIRAGWVKRVLFLCDRRELRKQAFNAFGQFVEEPMTRVTARTAKDRDKRIYFATYPAMQKIYQTFDPGFFQLVIADESHRSIYKVYGELFRYFDALQVGLTATPVEFVLRNTFDLFDCGTQDPTFNYPYERAISEGYLVPFEVIAFTTDFLRRGIKYEQLSQAQREELEDQGEDPKLIDYDPKEIDKAIYNADTNRLIIRNLMESGVRDATGQEVGKTIVFARNHEHAVHLQQVFDELYPQYGGRFCQVIDNYDSRAEQLIDDFKNPDNELTIAISVDMLDTGIDVPEIVNLVFAKPVFSKVKFWQMIGRGTRLRKDLFGVGEDKKFFRVFDHWGNFDYFDFRYQHREPPAQKSLLQQLFEARLDLAEEALREARPDFFKTVTRLLEADLDSLDERTIAVREKWRQRRTLTRTDVLQAFTPGTVQALRSDMAPLMQWVNIRGKAEARRLDLLIARMQHELMRGSSRFVDLKIELLDRINALAMNLNPVQEKAELIRALKGTAFWTAPTVEGLEQVRAELREIIHHRAAVLTLTGLGPRIVDITDTGIVVERRSSSLPAVDMEVYRQRVEEILTRHFQGDPTLLKIRRADPVTAAELHRLASLVLTQNPDVQLEVLKEFYDTAMPLDHILRSIVGVEPEVVRRRFEAFVQRHPSLTAKQTRFLSLLQNHIARYGSVAVERLYDAPFTQVDADGLDGVFGEPEADELVGIIETFAPRPNAAEENVQ
jgi:type I restriction enzyme R subunit